MLAIVHLLLAYFQDIVVGGVCCKVDNTDGKRCLYIMTLGVLAPYRRYGVGMYIGHFIGDMVQVCMYNL